MPDDHDKFKSEVVDISEKISDLLVDITINHGRPGIDSVVFALLKVAAFIAEKSNCKKESFIRLASIAFENSDISKDKQLN